jgi:ribonuclease BN (tRNA processing enzyme)
VDGNDDVVMEPIFTLPGQPTPTVPVINPQNPVPGIVDTTNYLYQAFALDLNDRMRDNLKPDLHTLFDVHDIVIPRGIGYQPNTNPSPTGMAPINVYEDEKVRVTATLVDHFPLVPAFAYRFETDDGVVMFPGDTNDNQNLISLARGADILVHECIDPAWVNILFPPPLTPAEEALMHHLLSAHTLPGQAGQATQQAGVSTLVLSHLVPASAPASHWLAAKRTVSGQLVVGNDLMEFGVGKKPAPPSG